VRQRDLGDDVQAKSEIPLPLVTGMHERIKEPGNALRGDRLPRVRDAREQSRVVIRLPYLEADRILSVLDRVAQQIARRLQQPIPIKRPQQISARTELDPTGRVGAAYLIDGRAAELA
jgi:hypothetical protein